MKLERPNTFGNPVLLSDGIGSAGKRMLAHILASFGNVEKMSHHFVFDYIAHLHWLGHVTDDAAIAYLQLEADLQTYQLMLSRDQNFRPGDTTSIFSDPRPLRYLRRLWRDEGDATSRFILETKPVLHESTHDGLRNATLYFSAFKSRLKLCHIIRHPVDLIIDLDRRGFGSREGTDPREFQFTLTRDGGPVVIALKDMETDLRGLPGIEIAAYLVRESMRLNLHGYEVLNQIHQKDVRFVFFDDLCSEPHKLARELSQFLGQPTTRFTNRAIRREKLPRLGLNRSLTRKELLRRLSSQTRNVLEEAESLYCDFATAQNRH